MRTRRLGAAGPELSVIGLGGNNVGWRLDPAPTAAVVHAAIDAGITHIDTAEMYGEGRSEEYIGAALGGRRESVVGSVIAGAMRPDQVVANASAADWVLTEDQAAEVAGL